MIKYTEPLPGIKKFKSHKDVFAHISDELTKFHNSVHTKLKKADVSSNQTKVGQNVPLRK